jgi:hypothetical protein
MEEEQVNLRAELLAEAFSAAYERGRGFIIDKAIAMTLWETPNA